MTERTAGKLVGFTLCMTILIATALYRGHIFPHSPIGQSFYDQTAYMLEIGIWCLAITMGALIGRDVWIPLKRHD